MFIFALYSNLLCNYLKNIFEMIEKYLLKQYHEVLENWIHDCSAPE